MTSALLSLVLSISMIALSSGECANFKILFYTGSLRLQKNLLPLFELSYLHIFPGNQFTCVLPVSVDNTPPVRFEYRSH